MSASPSDFQKNTSARTAREPADPSPFGTRTKLLTRYGAVIESIRAGGDPFPLQMEVNLTNACNQRCPNCIGEFARPNRGSLDLGNPAVVRFFADFRRAGGQCVAWSGGGEPTCHPHFERAIDLARANSLPQGLLTNGTFKSHLASTIASHCAWVRISLDAADAESYAKRRRVSSIAFSEVLANVGQRDYRGCVSHRVFVVLNYNGELTVCMYHLHDPRFVLGSILERSLEAIWHSPQRKRVVGFCEGRLDPQRDGCQVCCKGHEINKVISGVAPCGHIEVSADDSPFL